MGLSCGLVGVPSCGKTVIFNAITAAGADGYSAEMNRAIVKVPDERILKLAAMYNPRKLVPATLDVVDIPGLRSTDANGKGSSLKQLGHIKDVEALLHVVRCFEDDSAPFAYDTIDPVRDIETVDLELLAVDALTLENKLTRLSKKARTGDKDTLREVAACEKVRDAIQQGIPARRQDLTAHELASIAECNLVSMKPMLYVANVKSLGNGDAKYVAALEQRAREEHAEVVVICGKDEAEISQLAPEDRAEFLKELGLEKSSMERLLSTANSMLGLVNFFTVGEDEVRSWTCRKGDTAPVAAGKIHTDLEKGFVRMEVIRYEDLIALGSEDAVAKAGKQRVEGRDYQVQDGDIVVVRFNKGK